MQALCLKCQKPVDVVETNEFTRAFGVVCKACRARYSQPPREELPESERSPDSYEDANDLLTESSRDPPALHPIARPKAPPTPPPAPKATATPSPPPAGVARGRLPQAKSSVVVPPTKPVVVEAKPEAAAAPAPPDDDAPPPSSVGKRNSAIEDLRAMAAPRSSRPGQRRLDDDLVRLGGGGFMSAADLLPPPTPFEEAPEGALGRAALQDGAGLDDPQPGPCPHCGKRPDEPVAVGHALRHVGTAFSTNAPVASASQAPARAGGVSAFPASRPRSVTPWAIAAASLVVALVSVTARRDAGHGAAPPPRATSESAARIVNGTDDLRGTSANAARSGDDSPANETPLGLPPKSKEARDSKSAASGPDTKTAAGDPSSKAKSSPSAIPVSGAGRSFDTGAAGAAMSSAASQSGGCKKPGDPSGVAKVTVTFAPSGKATNAQINGPPFAGTSTGSCLARLFRAITVPPFEGAPVAANKTVSIR